MPTETEELQVKEFLKRAEIKTMKKDLAALREDDALKERDKIVKIKTLEEQRLEQEKKLEEKEKAKAAAEKSKREDILEKNAVQERDAEKDLKEYATEQEKQQIFQFESERFNFVKQADAIDKEKGPALKLQKNEVFIEKKNWETKLNTILADEKKLEDEQNFVAQKAQQTNIGSEKKSLEQRRWDLDKNIQEIEKKRWEVEKQIEALDSKIDQIDKSSEQLVGERNLLKQKILGIDKSLREIYSGVIAREEEKRRGMAAAQKAQKDIASRARFEQREKIQREQWANSGSRERQLKDPFDKSPARKNILETTESEQEQRKNFIQDVENWAEDKNNNPANQQQPQNSGLPVPPKKN